MWAVLLPLRELPWGQVLIDGPLIHYAVTATLLLWPWVAFFWTTVRAAEISLQSQNHTIITFATCLGQLSQMCTCKTIQLTHIELQTQTHLITLNDMRHVLTARSLSGYYMWTCKASRAHMSFLISINGKKRLTDTYKYWISSSCDATWRPNLLFFSFLLSQSIKSQRAWPSGVLGEQEQRLVWFYYCTAWVCVCVEGNVSLPLTVGARPAYCTVKTGALNCFRHWALSNECDSNRSSWGHRH